MNMFKLATAVALLLMAFSPVISGEARAQGSVTINTSPRVVFDSGAVNGSAQQGVLDVVWCRGDGKADQRALRAAEVAGGFATVARFASSLGIPNYAGVTVRTRSIDKTDLVNKIQSTLGQSTSAELLKAGEFVLYNGNDPPSVAVTELVTKTDGSIRLQSTYDSTTQSGVSLANYAAMYVCGGLDPSALSGQLYFQANGADAKSSALTALDAVREQYPGIATSGKIEVLPSKSPNTSELRYFFPSDSEAAQALAKTLSGSSDVNVTPKLIQGYESKVRPGSFEAWLVK